MKHNFKELIVWKKSVDLIEEMYSVTKDFPVDERFGLVSQIRRAATSISANIAEGSGQSTNKSFVHYLSIAQGSCFELQSHLIISERMGFIKSEMLQGLIEKTEEVQKMNHSFAKRLSNSK